jgi:hypothetical protein
MAFESSKERTDTKSLFIDPGLSGIYKNIQQFESLTYRRVHCDVIHCYIKYHDS